VALTMLDRSLGRASGAAIPMIGINSAGYG
jgi:hypothetical protein